MANIFNSDNFKQEVLEDKGLVLVDFYADWCGPCKMLGPVVEELAGEYEGKVKVGKLNVDNSPEIAVGYKVMNIPTVLLFKAGEQVETSIGLVSKADLVSMIEKNL